VDIAAEKATELPRLGKPRMKLNVHESQTSMKAKKSSVLPIWESKVRWKNETVLIGERHRWSTLCRKLEPGIVQSLLKAYITHDSYVTVKMLPSMQITITHQKPFSFPRPNQASQETSLTNMDCR
jgi:hypothetical protein